MRLERLTDPKHAMFEKAMALYRISFPPHEQREAESQRKILSDSDYQFQLIYDGETFAGILLCWETEDLLYVEHFCILPEMRNRKYGQRALALLRQREKPVILEIDPPVDEVSIHRKGFYERCGFIENPYPHVHPPYHAGNTGHSLVIMSYPDRITQSRYDAFRRYLERRVMKDAFSRSAESGHTENKESIHRNREL